MALGKVEIWAPVGYDTMPAPDPEGPNVLKAGFIVTGVVGGGGKRGENPRELSFFVQRIFALSFLR